MSVCYLYIPAHVNRSGPNFAEILSMTMVLENPDIHFTDVDKKNKFDVCT